MGTKQFFLVLMVCTQQAFSQTELSPIAYDCDAAIGINVGNAAVYGPTVALMPPGSSKDLRATNKGASSGAAATVWYLLHIQQEGRLSFEIRPTNRSDDYDFFLFPYAGATICDSFYHRQPHAIRSNSSRCDTTIGGLTGLRFGAGQPFADKTSVNSFSDPLPVKAGEAYLLVLSNKSEKGSGHQLNFAYTKDVSLQGRVVDEQGKGVLCSVDLLNMSGHTMFHANTDTQGQYRINLSLEEHLNYSLVFTCKSFYFASRMLNTDFMSESANSTPNRTTLPALQVGRKISLEHFEFEGGSSRLTRESSGALLGLYHLLRQHKKMSIAILGHCSTADGLSSELLQELSQERATIVYRYLLRKGIDKSRLSIMGKGSAAPLFPHPQTESEHRANRRVEIEVKSY